MKIPPFFPASVFLALFLALTASAPSQSQAPDVKSLFQEGLTAYEAENWQLAAQKFAQVYRLTQNPRAQYYLRNAQLKLAQGQPTVSLERQLSQVIIPSVEFVDTDVPTALDYLRTKTVELSQGKVQPNFLYRRDPNNPVLPVVSLQLSNIPVSEVLRYIGDLSRTKFKYETHAVVGIPASLSPPEPAP